MYHKKFDRLCGVNVKVHMPGAWDRNPQYIIDPDSAQPVLRQSPECRCQPVQLLEAVPIGKKMV